MYTNSNKLCAWKGVEGMGRCSGGETVLSNSIKENSYDVCLLKHSKFFLSTKKNEFLYMYIEKQEGPPVLTLTL